MSNLNTYLKISLNLFLIFSITTVLYYTFQTNSSITKHLSTSGVKLVRFPARENETQTYNVWFIFTKVSERSPLTLRFKALLTNMLDLSSVPLHLHLFVDAASKGIARRKVLNAMERSNKTVLYSFYDVEEAAKIIEDIVNVMMPHFSSKPGVCFRKIAFKTVLNVDSVLGTYYSDALFYLSLGMHRIAPKEQAKAVMLDCDLYFKRDIALLFKEFEK